MTTRNVEIGVGLFVALGLASLLVLAMKVSNLAELSGDDGFEISARFDNVGGLKVRSPVSIGGVKIGRVSSIRYDSNAYVAVVTMAIGAGYDRLPKDSSASIFTSGLLGEQYVGIEPGGEEEFLKPGDELELTQSAVVLEQIIGQFLYSQAGKRE